jgi:hypothetical protein
MRLVNLSAGDEGRSRNHSPRVTMIWALMLPWVLAAVAIPLIPALRTTLRENRRVRMNATVANGEQAQLRPARVRSRS